MVPGKVGGPGLGNSRRCFYLFQVASAGLATSFFNALISIGDILAVQPVAQLVQVLRTRPEVVRSPAGLFRSVAAVALPSPQGPADRQGVQAAAAHELDLGTWPTAYRASARQHQLHDPRRGPAVLVGDEPRPHGFHIHDRGAGHPTGQLR